MDLFTFCVVIGPLWFSAKITWRDEVWATDLISCTTLSKHEKLLAFVSSVCSGITICLCSLGYRHIPPSCATGKIDHPQRLHIFKSYLPMGALEITLIMIISKLRHLLSFESFLVAEWSFAYKLNVCSEQRPHFHWFLTECDSCLLYFALFILQIFSRSPVWTQSRLEKWEIWASNEHVL